MISYFFSFLVFFIHSCPLYLCLKSNTKSWSSSSDELLSLPPFLLPEPLPLPSELMLLPPDPLSLPPFPFLELLPLPSERMLLLSDLLSLPPFPLPEPLPLPSELILLPPGLLSLPFLAFSTTSKSSFALSCP